MRELQLIDAELLNRPLALGVLAVAFHVVIVPPLQGLLRNAEKGDRIGNVAETNQAGSCRKRSVAWAQTTATAGVKKRRSAGKRIGRCGRSVRQAAGQRKVRTGSTPSAMDSVQAGGSGDRGQRRVGDDGKADGIRRRIPADMGDPEAVETQQLRQKSSCSLSV